MTDERIRVRMSFNPNNDDDIKIIKYLDNKSESNQLVIKRILLKHINDESQEKTNISYYEIKEKDKTGKKRISKKNKKSNTKIIAYEKIEKNIPDFVSLEQYAIEKKLEPDIMNMMAFALDCGIDHKIILSMVENNLSANQMRAVIDLIMAKKPSFNNTPIIKSAKNNKSNKENKKNVKENDPLAVELKGVPDDIDDK